MRPDTKAVARQRAVVAKCEAAEQEAYKAWQVAEKAERKAHLAYWRRVERTRDADRRLAQLRYSSK